MAKWVPVNQDRFMAPRDEVIAGVKAQVFRSVLDLPIALKAEYDPKTLSVVIDLKYLGEEPTAKVVRMGDPPEVRVRVAPSGRLLQISLPIPAGVRRGAVDATLKNAVEALLTALASLPEKNRLVRADNVEVAATAIRENKQPLFSSLIPCTV